MKNLMKHRTQPKFSVWTARMIVALCVWSFLIPVVPAQNARRRVNNRVLLIFETSAAMQKRVVNTKDLMDEIFMLGMGGELHPGDTIGVWTYDHKLRTGQLPLQYWVPNQAATIASNIIAVVKKQHYDGRGNFEGVAPLMNRVIQNSDRLTTLIFCDGETPISGTPYDDAINHVFSQQKDTQKKAHQPLVVILRSQFGQYVGANVGAPPAMINFPPFPPLPQLTEPANGPSVVTNAPPTNAPPVVTNPPPVVHPQPVPTVELPSLIISGTNVTTNVPPTTPAPEPEPALVPAPVVPAVKTAKPPPTNHPSAKRSPPIAEPLLINTPKATNAISIPPKISAAKTNSPVPTNVVASVNRTEPPDSAASTADDSSSVSRSGALKIGVVLLVAAIALVAFIVRRARRNSQSSLITRSMNEK
jgi:hypothetical protein